MIKRTVVALALGAFVFVNTAAAQETATVTLKSGEQMSAQLIDLNASGLATKVNGQDRMIPINDVAVIDFTGGGGTQADWDKLASGQFVVLKDGQQITGQLTDIGGTSPLRLSFSTGGANRDLSSSEVARIVFARPSTAAVATTGTTTTTTTTTTTAPGGSLMVPGQQAWTPTGLTVRRGEVLTFTANGQVTFPGNATPAGSGELNAGNPVPSAPTGALIGRIGDTGQPFVIGPQATITAPAAGQLFVGINDSNFGDNGGSFQVQIGRSTRR